MFRFITFLFIFFPLMAMFWSAINLPHLIFSAFSSLYTFQVPEDLMQWCVHKVIAELIIWFLSVEMFMFAVLKLLFVGLVQCFLPLFW